MSFFGRTVMTYISTIMSLRLIVSGRLSAQFSLPVHKSGLKH